MKVFWATAAQRDRADIIDYISQDSPLAAIRMDELFVDAAAQLTDIAKAAGITGVSQKLTLAYRVGLRANNRRLRGQDMPVDLPVKPGIGIDNRHAAWLTGMPNVCNWQVRRRRKRI